MTDIVERLRDYYEAVVRTALSKLCGEAADEIERLSSAYNQLRETYLQAYAEIKRLQDALDTCRELRKFDAATIKQLWAVLKGIEVYATSKEDAKGMAAKALLDTTDKEVDHDD